MVDHLYTAMGCDSEDRPSVVSFGFVVRLYPYWMHSISMVSSLCWLFLRVDCILSEYALRESEESYDSSYQ